MSSRTSILERLKKFTPQTKSSGLVTPPAISQGDMKLFVEKASAAGAKVSVVAELTQVGAKIAEILAQEAGGIIYSGDDFLKEVGIDVITTTHKRTASEVHLEKDTDYRTTVYDSSIGITSCHYAIAETGSVVIAHQHSNERLISLAPETFVCILKEEQILADRYMLAQIIEEKNKTEPASAYSIITGVSRTADVALQVVLGMHGPKNVYIIVCESS